MTDPLDAVLATDEIISAYAERRAPDPAGDPVARALSAMVDLVDGTAAPRVAVPPAATTVGRRRGRRGLGLAIGVALACTSSGIAAAVTGDPLLPITFVARHLSMLGHDPDVDRWDSSIGQPRLAAAPGAGLTAKPRPAPAVAEVVRDRREVIGSSRAVTRPDVETGGQPVVADSSVSRQRGDTEPDLASRTASHGGEPNRFDEPRFAVRGRADAWGTARRDRP